MTSKFCRDKAVVVAVYAEKPRGQGVRHQAHHHLHHHHHHYHHLHQNVSKNDGKVRGYSRKAELLEYARHLRAPTKPEASHPSSHTEQPSTVEILPADGTIKQKHSGSPTCFDKWRFVVTRFIRCTTTTALKTNKGKVKRSHKKNVSASTKMKALVKSLQVQKKGSFLSKLLKSLKKQR